MHVPESMIVLAGIRKVRFTFIHRWEWGKAQSRDTAHKVRDDVAVRVNLEDVPLQPLGWSLHTIANKASKEAKGKKSHQNRGYNS
jgi:hypothetical protein